MHKIYVVDHAHNTITTYLPDETQTTPTITAGLDGPHGIAVDKNGKIYVANYVSSTSRCDDVSARRNANDSDGHWILRGKWCNS